MFDLKFSRGIGVGSTCSWSLAAKWIFELGGAPERAGEAEG